MKKLIEIMKASKEEVTEAKVKRAVKAAERESTKKIMTLEDRVAAQEDKEEEWLASATDVSKFNPGEFIIGLTDTRLNKGVAKEKLKIAKAIHKELF